MDYWFFVNSFFIGVLAASGCGFFKGFVTAVGASLGDGLYFLLGLIGVLAFVGELKSFMIFLDIIGGIILIVLGINSLKKMRQLVCVSIECSRSVFWSMGKAFTLTVLNPLVIMFFMAISISILPDNVVRLPWNVVLVSSFFVMLGSLFVLSIVSLVASYLGSCITTKRLRIFSGISGIAFIIFGLYLFCVFFLELRKLLHFC